MTVTIRNYDNVSDFLSDLRLSSSRWLLPATTRNSWLFRGQADADWKILPQLWRPTWWRSREGCLHCARTWIQARAVIERADTPISRRPPAWRQRAVAVLAAALIERDNVDSFSHIANELGFAIDDSSQFTDYDVNINTCIPNFSESTLHPRPIAALAQHHGIPTRLIDWTSNPLVAAYFAAEDAYQTSRRLRRIDDKKLAVWACETSRIPPKSRIHAVRLPAYRSDFLRAQKGTFLFDRHSEDEFIRYGKLQCFSEIVDKTVPSSNELPSVVKMTLPWGLARHLYGLLVMEGVSRAHLMPTLDNAARVSMDQALGRIHHIMGLADTDEIFEDSDSTSNNNTGIADPIACLLDEGLNNANTPGPR